MLVGALSKLAAQGRQSRGGAGTQSPGSAGPAPSQSGWTLWTPSARSLAGELSLSVAAASRHHVSAATRVGPHRARWIFAPSGGSSVSWRVLCCSKSKCAWHCTAGLAFVCPAFEPGVPGQCANGLPRGCLSHWIPAIAILAGPTTACHGRSKPQWCSGTK
jgi:hypothetical protein